MRSAGVCMVLPEVDRVGGYELNALALARRLAARGLRVLVVTHSRGEGPLPSAGDGVEVVRIVVRARRTLVALFPRLLALLFRRRREFSVIHCHTFGYMSALAVLAGRVARRPVVLRVASERDVREFALARHWKGRLFFRLLRRGSAVIAPNASIRDELRRAGFADARVLLLPNGVDVERFRPGSRVERAAARRALGLPEEGLLAGTVGRLAPEKAVDLLLRAFARAPAGARLCVVGDGPERPGLEALARDLGIGGRVTFAGETPDPAAWLRAMDVFALPSPSEGSPNALLEAMASGLPVVASRIAGVLDVLDPDRTGLAVPPGDVDALAGALARLLGDGDLRRDLGAAARRRAETELSLDARVDELLRLYSTVGGAF